MKSEKSNSEPDSNFCQNCGQPTKVKRIDGKYILNEIGSVILFERGILFTIKELLIRPGENVRIFISEDRNRLIKPILFIIITSLVYSLINHLFHIEDGYVNYDEIGQSATGYIFSWVQDYYGYANIIMGLFIAFWIKIFFKKYDYNFFEILILLCFVMGIGMLIYSVFALVKGITSIDLMQYAGIVGFIYSAWAIGQFFDKSKFFNYIKALFSYILGFLTFSLTAILIGTLIDLIAKY